MCSDGVPCFGVVENTAKRVNYYIGFSDDARRDIIQLAEYEDVTVVITDRNGYVNFVSTIEYVKGTMDKKDISEQVLVENAINKRLTSGALNKSGLTIEEFNTIKETLVNIKEQQ